MNGELQRRALSTGHFLDPSNQDRQSMNWNNDSVDGTKFNLKKIELKNQFGRQPNGVRWDII